MSLDNGAHADSMLALRHVWKSFGGTVALRDVDLTVARGEVHGLLGENGSGKSTLIKILSGYHAPDQGELTIANQLIRLPVRHFRSIGMDFVHQDLGLIPSLSVTDNLLVPDLATMRRRLHISWAAERRRAGEVFSRYGLALDPSALVSALIPVERALLAIVRAVERLRRVSRDSEAPRGLLVLDEPTVFLPRSDVDVLFGLIRNIALSGGSVLLVSHDLGEVCEITDSITVLRDGAVVGNVRTQDTTEADLVKMIVGRSLQARPSAKRAHSSPIRASVRGLTGLRVRDVSFDLREGEILGVTGRVGSGFEEIGYLLFGARNADAGTISIDGKEIELRTLTPAKALAAGVALVPADRQLEGVIPSLPAADGLLLRSLDDYFRWGVLHRWRMLGSATRLMAEFDVRPAQPRNVYASFSGGNQQKALLATWLSCHPRVLLLCEPTQGVDVGARQQIWAVIRDVATKGASILCASADYEQLEALCRRVIVVSHGYVSEELSGSAIARGLIAEACYRRSTDSWSGAP